MNYQKPVNPNEGRYGKPEFILDDGPDAKLNMFDLGVRLAKKFGPKPIGEPADQPRNKLSDLGRMLIDPADLADLDR